MKARIATTAATTRIELDGKDIGNATTGATLRLEPGVIPRLELDLAILEAADFTGEVRVHIPAATREVLIDLGWTPPEEDQ